MDGKLLILVRSIAKNDIMNKYKQITCQWGIHEARGEFLETHAVQRAF